jgi:hypothetical protein
MRGPTVEENLNIIPPDIRVNTKTSQAYLDLRRKISRPKNLVILPGLFE